MLRDWAKFTGYLLSIAVALAALAFLAMPSAAQAYTATGLPTGVVRFVAPDGALVLAPGQVSRDVAVLPPGAVVTVLTEWDVVVTFWRLDRTAIEGEPRLAPGERIAACAFVVAAGARVAVEAGCGCIAPELARLWPGAVAWSSDDPTVATVGDSSVLCSG